MRLQLWLNRLLIGHIFWVIPELITLDCQEVVFFDF